MPILCPLQFQLFLLGCHSQCAECVSKATNSTASTATLYVYTATLTLAKRLVFPEVLLLQHLLHSLGISIPLGNYAICNTISCNASEIYIFYNSPVLFGFNIFHTHLPTPHNPHQHANTGNGACSFIACQALHTRA